MKPPAYTPFIPAPTVLPEGEPPPMATSTITIAGLCALAGIPVRATSAHTPRIHVIRGGVSYRGPDAYYVGLGAPRRVRRPEDALRVLEILAHGFHDYAARECICGRKLFVPPRRRGRPPLRGRPMSAAERMRRSRAGRVASTRRPRGGSRRGFRRRRDRDGPLGSRCPACKGAPIAKTD